MHLRFYEVAPRVPYDEEVGFAHFAGTPFFVMYARESEELKVYLATMVSKQSLLHYVGAKEAETLPAHYRWWGRLKYRKGKAFYHDVEPVDMQSFLRGLPPGSAYAVWASAEPHLVGSHLGRLDAVLAKSGISGTKGRAAQVIREKLKEPILLADVRILAPRLETLRELEAAFLDRVLVLGFRTPLEFREGRIAGNSFAEWVRTPPRASAFSLLLGKRPFNMSAGKLAALAPIPNPSVIPIPPSRGLPLPDLPPIRPSGFTIGATPTGRVVKLDEGDLVRHCYIIGATGSGKTNALRLLVKNLVDRGSGAVVVLDPHGDLADSVAAYYAEQGARLTYFHPTLAPFSVNPLRLPNLASPEQARLLAMSNLMEMFTRVFWLGENAVYVKYILQNAMNALYSMKENPTFADVYRVILALHDGEFDIDGGPEWEAKLEFLKSIQQTSFVSALSRLELLATNEVLRRVFGSQDVDDTIFLEKGRLVAVNADLSSVGSEASYLIMAGFLMKLWYLVTARYGSGDRTPVFLIIDEFQRIADLSQVDVMLSEARKYGLHLILAHQHTGQLPDSVLKSVFSNTGMKLIMRINGDDVEKFKTIDRDFQTELGSVLSSLPNGGGVLLLTPRTIAEATAPIIVQVSHAQEIEEANRFKLRNLAPPPTIAPKHGGRQQEAVTQGEEADEEEAGDAPPTTEPTRPPEAGEAAARAEPPYTPLEQAVLYHVFTEGEAALVDLGVKLGAERGELERAVRSLAGKGCVRTEKRGRRIIVAYRDGFYRGLEKAAPSAEGFTLASRVLELYASKGYWVYPADSGKEGGAPDLVAVPLNSWRPIYPQAVAIEIETANEVETHPEQVARNMVKPSTRAYREVHVYTTSSKLGRVREILSELMAPPDVKAKVKVFAADAEPMGVPAAEPASATQPTPPPTAPLGAGGVVRLKVGSLVFSVDGADMLAKGEEYASLRREGPLTPKVEEGHLLLTSKSGRTLRIRLVKGVAT